MKGQVYIKLDDGAMLPTKATEGSAGYDLYSNEDITLTTNSISVIKTGIHISMERNMEAQIRSRSGLASKHGVFVLNEPGTIDSDYRGEVCVILANCGAQDVAIKKGMRIAQMVFHELPEIEFLQVNALMNSHRDQGGFGSTGV